MLGKRMEKKENLGNLGKTHHFSISAPTPNYPTTSWHQKCSSLAASKAHFVMKIYEKSEKIKAIK
jgi:hypothetical protein